MQNFAALGLQKPILQSLEKLNFSQPTPIQAEAIPPALLGRDVLGSAQTGTGKTAAFAIPALNYLLTDKNGMVIVLTPTRELAAQVLKNFQSLLAFSPEIKSAQLIGGESMYKQLQQLRQRPRLIVGTPGRINDHLQQGTLNLSTAGFLVLDETDRMLDMGFEVQIDRIVKKLPPKRQTLMFSATLPPYIVKLADKYLNKAIRIAVGSTNLPITRIKQELVHLSPADKYTQLLAQLLVREGSVIVFVKTKRGADKLAKKLTTEKLSAAAIHGDLNQSKRNRVIDAFRKKEMRILVATDVAARGLDIPHIMHVVNYDLPQVAEDYIHRIGRTARAGAEGSALCFITPEDREKWRDIHKLMNPDEKDTRDTRDSRDSKKPAARTHNYAKKRPFGDNRYKTKPGNSNNAPAGKKPGKFARKRRAGQKTTTR